MKNVLRIQHAEQYDGARNRKWYEPNCEKKKKSVNDPVPVAENNSHEKLPMTMFRTCVFASLFFQFSWDEIPSKYG